MNMVKTGKSKWLPVFLFFIAFCPLQAQEAITLRECYDSAMAVSSLSREKNMYSRISELKEKNISAGWFPAIDLNASALYNSDVTDLSSKFAAFPIPGISDAIGSMPHDQYKVTLDINQVFYDGGAIRSARKLESAELRVNQTQTETDLYKVKSQVNGYFFNILLLRRQRELYDLYLELIGKRLRSVQSAVENGVMLRSDADVLRAEMINLQQQISENEIRSNSLLKALSDLTGISLDTSTELVLPVQQSALNEEIARPEIALLDTRKDQLSAGESLAASKRMPKAFGFATLGYGNPPGSNFFTDEFDTYYIIGASIKWNVFDWNRAKNEKQVISLQKNLIDNRRKDLTDNIRRQLELKASEISNLEKIINSDAELAEIRKRVSASAESQHENGTITATEYLNVLNAEKQVMINAEIHRINLALARIEYLNISGHDPE